MFTTKRVIVGVLVILSVWGGVSYYRSKNDPVAVQTETVKRGNIAEIVSVTGELVPKQYADLSFQSMGEIDEINVEEGQKVKVGQRIASVNRAVLFSQLKQARIAASITEQNEQQARVRRNTLGKRWDDLKPEERTAITLKTEQARENVRALAAQMQESVITAPLDGYITKLNLRVGEIVTLGKVIGRVATVDAFVVESRVPESDILDIALDMRAQMTFDAFSSDEIFQAHIISIAPAATVMQDVVSYVVKFRLDNADDRLKEGMTANIDIETAKRDNVLTLPFRALTKEDGKTFAQVKQADGTFVQTTVTTGLEGDDGTIEIKSGLKEGDEVSISVTQIK